MSALAYPDDDTPDIWTDPATGRLYSRRTMEPVTVAGESLGERPSAPIDAPPLTDDDVAAFTAQLSRNPEEDL